MLCQKILDLILRFSSLWRFQINKSFIEFHPIIDQISTLNVLWIFKRNVLQNVVQYSFLVIDAALALDNPLLFRKNLVETIEKLITAIDDKIRDEKLQYDINREAAKIWAHHQVKLININISQVKKYYFLIIV